MIKRPKLTVKEAPMRKYLACPPTHRIIGDHLQGLSLQDKQEMFEKIGRDFRADNKIPFLVDEETMYNDEDLYDSSSIDYFHEFICEMNDEKFEEEMKILKEYYNTKGEEFYREKQISSELESDEVIENFLSWIPVFFKLKLQKSDKKSIPLVPLNINSKDFSCLGLF